MEFWGAEVKSGEPLLVKTGGRRVLHLSQACLGEVKKDKGNESVCLFANLDGKKFVLGTLTHEKLPQQIFDLVFDRDFELTHNWKNGSVYFYGYKATVPTDESDDEFDSDSEEDIPLHAVNNGKQETQAKQEKPPTAEKANAVKDSASGKQKVKIVEPNKDVKSKKDEDDESDDSMFENESESDEDTESGSDDDEEDDDSDEEDEETPKKVEPSKKRPMESATKTPGPDKKAKVITPQKTDGKKSSGYVATPYPSKQAGKTPANKPNQQTPKSEGSHSCKPCNRTFKSESALESHTKAKHSAGK